MKVLTRYIYNLEDIYHTLREDKYTTTRLELETNYP